MNFGAAIKHVFANITNLHGRARRSEYWWWQLFILILNAVVQMFIITPLSNSMTPVVYSGEDFGALFAATFMAVWTVALIISLVFFLLSFSVTVRRLHDTNRSAFNLFWLLLPIVGPIIVFIYTLLDSTPGSNNYGANPKE